MEQPLFGDSKFVPVFLEKIVGKIFEQPFLAILNLYQSFWEKFKMATFGHSEFSSLFGKNCQKTFGTANFGHSEFIPVFLEKIVRKNLEWPFQIFSDNFSVHITLVECNALESNEICTFLDFYSEI